jgi:5'-methylthioadenosine phosphorylase
MSRIGLIAGTIMFETDLWPEAVTRTEQTPFGPALVRVSDDWAYVPRHGLDDSDYIPPHLINHPANLWALQNLGAAEIVSLGSTGSLSMDLPPGTLVVPDDFMTLAPPATVVFNRPHHALPRFSDRVRGKLLEAAGRAGVAVRDGGVYFQTTGPRLETRAEIRFLARFADVVGMTVASEAGVASELGLDLAALCSVDNFGHGVSEQELSAEIIRAEAKKSVAAIGRILAAFARA